MIDVGDTGFVLLSSGLVLLMTPGLAFFYGGMVRKKNVISILLQCFAILALISIQWVLFGYSLCFGPDLGGVIGSLKWAGLQMVGSEPNPFYAGTIPHQAFMIFQAMFAIITPALIIGAFAERIKFSAFFVFIFLWATLVYAPIAHWVWGMGGWLRGLGALDFAGGTVVHINAGISGLVMTILLGKRQGFGKIAFTPHNLPLTVIGTGLLWFGWFGFNAGSALSANGIAVNAFVTTNTAAASAGLTWLFIEWIRNRAPTMLGIATGAVAGLVAITPGCGFVSPVSSIMIGAIASLVCYLAVAVLKPWLSYDDSLDAFGVHGVGGIWGAIATGIFANKNVNPAGADGLLLGNLHQIAVQLLAVLVTILYAGVMTFILAKIIDKLIGLRVELKDEITGVDLSLHKEAGYSDLD